MVATHRQRMLGLLGTVVVLLAGGASSAQARPQNPDCSSTAHELCPVSASPDKSDHRIKFIDSSWSASDAFQVTCEGLSYAPLYAGGGSQIWGEGETSCNAFVPWMKVTVQLWKLRYDGVYVLKAVAWRETTNDDIVQQAVFVSCRNANQHRWLTQTFHEVRFPSGEYTSGYTSNSAIMNCGA
jgi:hypothetical protein